MIEKILLDIEGTTTPIDFVHKVLFPYSKNAIPEFVQANLENEAVQQVLKQTCQTAKEEDNRDLTTEEAIDRLLLWIDQDRKHTALKQLQGMVWKYGYETKAYTSELYTDVAPAIRNWIDSGLQVGIYSSGSVAAQKLLFKYTEYGDITPMLSWYFDTTVGHKREKQSYLNIRESLKTEAEKILFLSDVGEELDAAVQAGFQVLQVIRPGTKKYGTHPVVSTFSEIGNIR